MADTLESIPYPLTPRMLEKLVASDQFEKAHPEVVKERWVAGEGMTTLVPALLLRTESNVFAIVESEENECYQVLERGSKEEEDEVYDALGAWCDAQGYTE